MGNGCVSVLLPGASGGGAAEKYSLRRRKSFDWFVREAHVDRALVEDAFDDFCRGRPDEDGQLDHGGFCQALGLSRDAYTNRLVRIFDLDNSGQVGFREYVYGLSKFTGDDFDTIIEFAYRLFDLDGDGTLDKNELYQALKSALSVDPSKYTLRPPKSRRVVKGVRLQVKPKVRRSLRDQSSKGDVWSKNVRADAQLKKEVEDLAGRRPFLTYLDFQVIVSHQPRLLQAAKYLYAAMQSNSEVASEIVESMSASAETKLLASLGREKSSSPFWDKPGRSGSGGRTPKADKAPATPSRLSKADQAKGGDTPGASADKSGTEIEAVDDSAEAGDKEQARRDRLDTPVPSRAGGSSGTDAAKSVGSGGAVATAGPSSGGQDEPDDAAVSIWSCETCTLHNDIQDRFCAACGDARPRAASAAAAAASKKSANKLAEKLGSIDVASGSDPKAKEGYVKGGKGDAKGSKGESTTGGSPHTPNSAGKDSRASAAERARETFDKAFADVKRWLESLGLASYVATFRKERVDSLELIMMMSEKDLIELGLPKGPRLRILNMQRREERAKAEADGEGDGEGKLCRICMAAEIEVLLRPCGHTMLCQQCAQNVDACPICRIDISERVRYFAA